MNIEPKQSVIQSPALTDQVQENIFCFAEPDHMHCKVSEYQYSHAVLILEIASEDYSKKYELVFSMVHQIAAVAHWQGANFRLMPLATSLEVALKHNLFGTTFEGYPPEVVTRSLDLAKVFHVIPIDKPDLTIAICAANAELRPKKQ